MVSEDIGMGLGQDQNKNRKPKSSVEKLKNWTQPSSEMMQTNPQIFHLSPFPDYMCHAFLVYLCEIFSILVMPGSAGYSTADEQCGICMGQH